MVRALGTVLALIVVAGCSSVTPAATPTASPAPNATTPSTPSPVPATPSASPTASPSAAPSPSSGPSTQPGQGFGAETPLFSDDFSDTSGGWQTASGDNGTVAYGNEMLQLNINESVSFISMSGPIDDTAWDVVRVEGTITVTDGYIGLLCADADGDLAGAVMGYDSYIFVRRVGGTIEALAPAISSTPLPQFSQSHLTVECAGTNTGSLRIRLSLNGVFVAEFETDTGPTSFSNVGVYVEAVDGSVFSLDNVAVFGGQGANLPPVATNPPPASASPGASATPSALLEQLLAHVPAQMMGDCSEVSSFDLGMLVGVQCINIPGVDGYVVYNQFDTLENMNAAYQSNVDFFGEEAAGDSCQVGPAELVYTIGGVPAGRLMCNNYDSGGDAPNGLIAYWTHEGLLIQGSIVLFSGTFQDIYNIWLTAGPDEATSAPTGAPGVQPGGSSWDDSASEFQGRVGERFAYQCPPGGRDLPVYGTDVYTDDSFVCVAAVHAGLITLAAGGDVVIEMRPGQDSYLGSERNGISSSNWGSWDGSFIFVAP